jgi:hypothetical protein
VDIGLALWLLSRRKGGREENGKQDDAHTRAN